MKVFYNPTHHQHYPPFEVFDGGEKVVNFEKPERMERILDALQSDPRFEICAPTDFGLAPIQAVHDSAYLDFLRTAYQEWLLEPTNYPKQVLLPATSPPDGRKGRIPATLLGRAGYYMTDLSCGIVEGTYQAALASAQCALSGANELITGARQVFALCRPPGHHAGRANCAGYCYINNAAVAANWLSSHGKTAILDIDYHVGNGTQDIFYERADVLTISIHADPDYDYPYFSGFADETGAGPGLGFHRNYPLPLGTTDADYFATLGQALERIRAFQPAYLVISAGMDIYAEDPLGQIRITRAGIAHIGREIAALQLPTLIVMEGGYNNAALGLNVAAFLQAWL